MTVTVCIPAYRAGTFIDRTLRSAAGQTYTDLRIEIAIDPSDDDPPERPDSTYDVATSFLHDPRFRVVTNPRRLGWAENVRAMLGRVRTPYFAILAHDDAWHPQYVEILLEALTSDHANVVAFADILRIGDWVPERKAVFLGDDRSRFSQVVNFMLGGADGNPWRGITRSEAMRRAGGFPTDDHMGFAVECEYALALLMQGPGVRVPRAMFYKRFHPREKATASRDRMRLQGREQRIAGLDVHNARMRTIVGPLLATGDEEIIDLALTTVALGRWQLFLGHKFDDVHLVRAQDALSQVRGWRAATYAARVAGRIHHFLSRHAAAADSQHESDLQAEAAFNANPDDYEIVLWFARRRLIAGYPSAALDLIDRMEQMLPNVEGAQQLRQEAYRQL